MARMMALCSLPRTNHGRRDSPHSQRYDINPQSDSLAAL